MESEEASSRSAVSVASARRLRQQVPPGSKRRRCIGGLEVPIDRQHGMADRMEPELELGDDPEVAATAAQAEEEVRMLVGGRTDRVAVGGDDRVRRHVVAGQPELARQPSHAATQRQAADAGVRDVARRGREPVALGRPIEVAQERTALHAPTAPLRIDRHRVHRAEVDHQPAFRHGHAGHAVATALHGDLEAGLAGVAHRQRDVVRRRAACDHMRTPIDHRVPDFAVLVERRITGLNDLAGEARDRHRSGCEAIWIRFPQVSSKMAVVTGPISVGGCTMWTPSASSRSHSACTSSTANEVAGIPSATIAF